MKQFVIFSDSTCDLDAATRRQYDIDYVPMNYGIDGQEYVASLDWDSHCPQTFYDMMRKGKRVFTTQVPKPVYHNAFSAALQKGQDVVYIGCSSALSGSIHAARTVAASLESQFPNNKVYCVDSLISSLGQGYLVLAAAQKRQQGFSAQQTAEYIDQIKNSVNQCGTVESLDYLKRSGRVTASRAFFGNLFGVKPIIISDCIGQNYAYKKAKGTVNARRAIAQHIAEAANGVYEHLYISHADCAQEAEALKNEIVSIAPFQQVTIGMIGPIVGSSVGPGTVIAFCFGKEVTIQGEQ